MRKDYGLRVFLSALLLIPIAGCATPYAQTGSPSAELASTQPLTSSAKLEALKLMLIQMGYTPTLSDDHTGLLITVIGAKQNYVTGLELINDDSQIIFATDLGTYTPAELKQLDAVSLLIQNDSDYCYFSLEQGKDGDTLFGNGWTTIQGLTAERLRIILASWIAQMDNSQDIWDPNAWQ